MSKHSNISTKQAKREKKAKQERKNKELLDLLWAMAYLGADVESSLTEFLEAWTVARLERLGELGYGKAGIATVALIKTLEIFHDAVADIYENAPEDVQRAFDATGKEAEERVAELEDSPVTLSDAQLKMRDAILSMDEVAHPAIAASDAACSAAESGYLVGMAMIEKTRIATQELAENLPTAWPKEVKLKKLSKQENGRLLADWVDKVCI